MSTTVQATGDDGRLVQLRVDVSITDPETIYRKQYLGRVFAQGGAVSVAACASRVPSRGTARGASVGLTDTATGTSRRLLSETPDLTDIVGLQKAIKQNDKDVETHFALTEGYLTTVNKNFVEAEASLVAVQNAVFNTTTLVNTTNALFEDEIAGALDRARALQAALNTTIKTFSTTLSAATTAISDQFAEIGRAHV
jgi:hypothetical protein